METVQTNNKLVFWHIFKSLIQLFKKSKSEEFKENKILVYKFEILLMIAPSNDEMEIV